MTRPRLALLRDFRQEEWPSMDLCADMLRDGLLRDGVFEVVEHDPDWRARATGLPWGATSRLARNADRVFNRYYDYPRQLARLRERCQLFHVVDHSYAQLLLALPAERSGVLVHDLDTFRCLLEPARDPRPGWYQRLIRTTLRGLTRAALVFHTTAAVREELLRFALVDEARLVHAPLGVAPEFRPAPEPLRRPAPEPEEGAAEAADGEAAEGAEPEPEPEPEPGYLLHVGSCIPRKRVDLLLEVFAQLRARFPRLRLIKVGGPWSPEQEDRLAQPDLAGAVEQQRDLSRAALAELYRGAALVLHPSDAEGFGLPLIEALACGAIVVASEIPAHLEVGGQAVVFCPPGRVEPWVETCAGLLRDPSAAPARGGRLHHARRFSWDAHARIVREAYQGLLPCAD